MIFIIKNMKYQAVRICPGCERSIKHTSTVSEKHVIRMVKDAIKNDRKCLSCARSGDNNPSKLAHVKQKRSEFFKTHNPSKGKPAWNRGLPRDNATKQKISETIYNSGGRSGERNPNFGKFKEHSVDANYQTYSSRVRVLTERNVKALPNYEAELRGKTGKTGAYQIDHIMSILDCWLLGISAEQAADVANLQFIPWEENLARRVFKRKINKK